MDLKNFKYISAIDPHSFARFTIEKRLPSILDKVIAAKLFDDEIQERLIKLKNDLPDLKVQALQLEKDEINYWENFFEEYAHKSILEIPFFYAEMYFYRYLLNITDFATNRVDPFSKIKADDLHDRADAFETLLQNVDNIEEAILCSLTDNTADLSQLDRNDSGLNIIVNHSSELVSLIEEQETIHIILDNARTELFSDFLLVKHILESHSTKKVILYPKKLPLLVSDATMEDVEKLFEFLMNCGISSLNSLMSFLNHHINKGNIEFVVDSYWHSPNHFTKVPATIQKLIKPNDLVIAKGDANYRRFYEDRKIPYNYRGAGIISSNQFALRTLKSEIIAGMELSKVDQLQMQDANWMVNGKYAVIQRIE